MTTPRKIDEELSKDDDPIERFWYVQEAGPEGRYLRVHADHMTVDNDTADLRFHNPDGSVAFEFLGGTWSYMEHGEVPVF